MTRFPTKMHLLDAAGSAICTRSAAPVMGFRRKEFFALDPAHRCAKCDAKAAKAAAAKAAKAAKIVPDEVPSGSKEHLGALSKFFGI